MGNNVLVERIAAIILEHRDADVRDVARLVLNEVRRAYEAWTREGDAARD